MQDRLMIFGKKWRNWILANPFNAFIGVVIQSVIIYIVWEFVFHPLAFIRDPLNQLNIRIAFTIILTGSIFFAIYVWWSNKQKH